MDERRELPPDATPRPPVVAGVGELSPVQRAYGAYTRHAIDCDACRDVDQTCGTAGVLWRTYREVSGSACRQISP